MHIISCVVFVRFRQVTKWRPPQSSANLATLPPNVPPAVQRRMPACTIFCYGYGLNVEQVWHLQQQQQQQQEQQRHKKAANEISAKKGFSIAALGKKMMKKPCKQRRE
ncbi:hypothetical protein AWZ03_000201 [Drosophila navojoa]|uniref:Uncharacterized protein n=1 Tax=Drosophila navojoa TaxID=7232 RepID=A0A484BX43_DRONA|nr:hypothetical protein AWZ03_000201 [Drosophila navojoa]